MKRKQHGHRPSRNTEILQILKEHTDKWLTCSEIVAIIGTCTPKSVSRRLIIISSDYPELECRKDATTRKHYFRYKAEVKAEMNKHDHIMDIKMPNKPGEKSIEQGIISSVLNENTVGTEIMNRDGELFD